jgi:uncharacterized protein
MNFYGPDVHEYPDFRAIKVGDKPLFDEAFRAYPPEISEFTFTNLYAWRDIYNFEISSLGSFLVLRSEHGPACRYFEPIGTGDIKAAVYRLLEKNDTSFIRITEKTALGFRGDEHIKIEPDRDNSDYLYKAHDLVLLAGRKYDGKRNLIRNFKASYNYEYTELSEANAKDCLEFEESWCTIRDCDNVESLDNERRAVKEIISNFGSFGLMGGSIKVDSRICAVAVSEGLNRSTMVMHILKANPGMAGLYQTMMHDFLSRNARPYEYINLEQDLGVDGLRKSKLSYHPASMINKYILYRV